MKKHIWTLVLICLVLLTTLLSVPYVEATEPQSGGGPLCSGMTEDHVFNYGNVACGSVMEVGGYDLGWTQRIWVGVDPNSTSEHILFDSITFHLPEGFIFKDSGGRSAEAAYIFDDVTPWSGGGADTPVFDAIYLPDAYDGQVFYMDVVFKGTAYPDWTYTNGYSFTQQMRLPFFKVRTVTTEATYSSAMIGNGAITWDEAMITSDYNQDAAELSAVLSALAYDRGDLCEFLQQLGCNEIKHHYQDPTGKPLNMGCTIGIKHIIQDGEYRRVILTVGRGTYTKSGNWYDAWEWIGNAYVGNAYLHRGFEIAGNSLYNLAKNAAFTDKEYEAKPFCFYTGHSKAAAAANLAGHWANQESQDCVTYTFATPTTVRGGSTTTQGEHGIYNYVYYQDIIRNAPSMAQFGRYGSTRIFGYETPSVDENAGMTTTWTDSYGITHLVVNGYTTQEMLNCMLYILSADDGVLKPMVELGTMAYWFTHNGNLNDFFFQNVLECHSMPVYLKAVRRNEPGADVNAVNLETEASLEVLRNIMGQDKEDYVAYFVCCPVNVFIYRTDGVKIAQIVEDSIWVNEFAYDGKLILFPFGEGNLIIYPREFTDNYIIEVEAYDEGSVTHGAIYLNADDTNQMVYQENTPIGKAELWTLDAAPKAGEGYESTGDEARMENLLVRHCGIAGFDEVPFKDVEPNTWFYPCVKFVYENGLMNGISDYEFAPAGTMNRAMLVTVLYRMAGQPEAAGTHPFWDVAPDSWYEDAVIWAYGAGVVNGTTADTFSPAQNIAREQIVTMFYRYAKYIGCEIEGASDLDGYLDTDRINNYAYDAFCWAVGNRIINGVTDNTLEPLSNTNRAQCPAIIQRFVQSFG